MFLKIVRQEIGIEELHECDRITTTWASKKDGNPLEFNLSSNTEYPCGNYSIPIDFEDAAMIYIMGSTGKTIDTVEHNPQPTT